MTRLEISFFVCETGTRVKEVTISDLISNQNSKVIQSTSTYIHIPVLSLDSLNIKLLSEASFNNLTNGASQGGYPAGNYMFKVNNRNSRTRCELCSKLTIKTPERRHR